VRIEEVLADQQPLDLKGPGPVRLGPGRGGLEFHYTALSFPVPEKNRFKYKLEGADPGWVEAGTRRVAYYNNLRPGNYRFRVMACNNDGVWNTAGSELALTLRPHFWQTWLFLGSVVVSAVAAAGGTARYNTRKKVQRELKRLEQQNAIEQERTRIARDMHDEIGAKLTKISFLGALAKRKLDVPAEAGKQIDKMSRTAREMIGALDEIVWAVNPANDTLDHLATYLCRYAAEFFENSPILCQFDIPAQLPHRRLSTDVRHNVFLAVKETLNNALKHSGATSLRLQISAPADVCKIVILDNGRGFSAGKVTSANGTLGGARLMRIGNGLTNMQQRLAIIGGQCLVESQAGQGTRIEFTVRLNEGVKNCEW
jgi:signal transduction histidine kinase